MTHENISRACCVEQKEAALKEAHRVLKKGGR
jgi:ubiquinone/menaquinone biosynthesis C-methylase UbiE